VVFKRPERRPRQRAAREPASPAKRGLGWVFAGVLICWAFVLGILVGQGSLATPEQVAWVKQALGLERLLGSEPAPPPQRLTEAQFSFYDRVKQQRQTAPEQPAAPGKATAKTPPAPAVAPKPDAPPAPAQATATEAKAAAEAKSGSEGNATPKAKPAEPPAPAGSAAPTQAEGNGRFAVQVASFSEENQAVNLVRRLQASGYRAYSLMVDVKGAGRRYRVRVGPYEQLDEAQGAAGRIRLQHKLAAYVTRRE
jgi:cell division septation protein DedD